MQGRQRKRPSSLTPESKKKLPPPILPWPPRTRQIHLRQPYLPRTLPLSHLHPLFPKSNPILHRWTSFPSWLTIASWPVTSARSISKTTCASIVVQKTTSWTPVPRSRPWCFSNCFWETLRKIESNPQDSIQTEGHVELSCVLWSKAQSV